MPEPFCDGIDDEQRERIIRSVESTCELCREYTPLSLLRLHGISAGRNRAGAHPKERERHILVVCEPCHTLIHAEPVPVKKIYARIAARPFSVRREFLLALGYVPKSVIPPDDQDYARIYDDTIKDFSGHYR